MAEPRIRHAMILAAGLGTRLRPLTEERPKPLIEVMGRPLITYALDHAHRAGAERVVINTSHLHPMIPEALGDEYAGMELLFSHEPEVLGTGGGIKRMSRLLDERMGPALIMNADALIDLDVEALLARHFEGEPPLATLVLKRTDKARAYGAIGTDEDGRIRTFAGRTAYEGPVAEERMFCGVHVIDWRVLDWLTDEEECCINQVGYPRILDEGHRVLAASHEGVFWDVGTPARLLDANLSLLESSVVPNFLELRGGLVERSPSVWAAVDAVIEDGAEIKGPVLLGRGATVAAGANLHRVVLGEGARVGPGVTLEDAVLLSGAEVQKADVASGLIASGRDQVPTSREAA